MGFIPYAYGTGASDAYEYHPINTTGAYIGKAMYMDGGMLAGAADEDKPTYVCMTNKADAAKGDIVAAIRVKPTTRFVTTFAANGATVKVGDKLQISVDGTQVTATTGGCFEVVEIKGTNIGDEVIGRFVEGGAA